MACGKHSMCDQAFISLSETPQAAREQPTAEARLRVLHDLRKADADVVLHKVHQHAVDIGLRRRV